MRQLFQKAFFAGCWISLAVQLYALSIGPALWLLKVTGAEYNPWAFGAWETFYTPLVMVVDRSKSELLQSMFIGYLEAWYGPIIFKPW